MVGCPHPLCVSAALHVTPVVDHKRGGEACGLRNFILHHSIFAAACAFLVSLTCDVLFIFVFVCSLRTCVLLACFCALYTKYHFVLLFTSQSDSLLLIARCC